MNCIYTCLCTLFLIGIGLWVPTHPVAYALKRADGSIAFAEPPLLVAAKTPYTDTDVWDTTYYFTLELPLTAGEPLQKVTFSQTESIEMIRFDIKHSRAFEGTQDHQGLKLALEPPGKRDRQTQTVTVKFDPPVSPGKTVTIALRTIRNPLYDGIYLLGVTAFPAGERTNGQFLGYGRLQFYTDGDNFSSLLCYFANINNTKKLNWQ